MPQTLFLGQTYPARSRNISSDRCINLFPEVAPPDAKGETRGDSVIALIGTPGSELAWSVAQTAVRGLHVFNSLLYFVAGDSLYSVDALGTVSAPLGTLATSSGRVIIIDNGLSASGAGGNQLFIVDGTNAGYVYNVVTNTFTATTGGTTTTFIDGYFIVNTPSSMVAASSDLFDGLTFGGLAVSPVSSTADNLMGVASLNKQLWMIKEFGAEIWYNNGTTTSLGFPFSPIPGTTIDYGTSAPYSIARGDQALFYLANARQNDGGKFAGVLMIQGNTPQIISPPSINYQISQYATISDAFGYCRVNEGHSFYVLTFPSANDNLGATYVYDRTTGMWHEWSSYKDPYQIARHLSNCYAAFNGNEYIGDFASGNIYKLSSNIFLENGDPIVSVRICQHQYDRRNLDNIFIMRLQVDMETGVGDSNVLIQTGVDPLAQLAWSNDGGHTYSNDYLASVGKVGLYKTRLSWRRLGYARDRVFRLVISDPIKKVLLGGYING